MKKHSLTSILITVSLLSACTVSIDRGEPALINPWQTNRLDVKIIGLKKAQERAMHYLIAGDYEQVENILHFDFDFSQVQWGPVVFVHNEMKTNRFRNYEYYYVFCGVLSDHSVVFEGTIDALNGKKGSESGGNRVHLLMPDDALDYLITRNIIQNKELYVIEAAFNYYPPHFGMYDNTDWRYKVFRRDGTPIEVNGSNYISLYIHPFNIENNKKPNDKNCTSPYNCYRLYGYSESKDLKKSVFDGNTNYFFQIKE